MLTPSALVDRARANAKKYPWAQKVRQQMIDAAAPWFALGDEDLWSIMYGPTITRSWDVWSNGHCPLCKKDVPLYNWEIDAFARPWKVRCPHCMELFPKNDYARYYASGLDERHIFDPHRADRLLLFNAEHPDPSDPLHRFCVDDGDGYLSLDHAGERWRFVGAYLIYGQWKQLMLGGIASLTNAHLITGDNAYAHKAAILLDRVADLYPSFDHVTQAWVEELFRCDGYVSTWHDACEETRWMALAFDSLRPAILADADLAKFLTTQARRWRIATDKSTGAAICKNIEAGILLDPIKNPHKIYSNYPRREIALATLHAALGWPERRPEVMKIVDAILMQATAVDGVTGEKGLAGYSCFVIQSLADFLSRLERLEPGLLRELLQRHPKLRETYRFHIDTWSGMNYYPEIGDTGWVAKRNENYVGVVLPESGAVSHPAGVMPGMNFDPSMYDFLMKLHEATGDVAYVQTLHHANGRKTAGLPYDLCAEDPEGFERTVAKVIAEHGPDLPQENVLKRDWCVALLKAGHASTSRAIWLAFDNGGKHAHGNGMNIGLFNRGLDLMPDFGYPPLQFSRANGPHVAWYLSPASHNTVVVDGLLPGMLWGDPVPGQCTLWGDGEEVSAVRASGVDMLLRRTVSQVYPLSGEGHEHVGLYFHTPGTAYRVRVWTRPEPADENSHAPGDEGWTLAFEDTFSRDELGPDWKAVEGKWRIEDGTLVGNGTLACTRRFPGCQRVELEAMTTLDMPCDLSIFLGGTEEGFAKGAFVGFGSGINGYSKIVLHNRDAQRGAARIVPGKRHTIRAERDGGLVRHVVDGQEVQRHLNTHEGVVESRKRVRRGMQYERTLVAMDLSAEDTYYLDVFRVRAGKDHAKFQHSHFAQMTTTGLDLAPDEDYGHESLMRDFKTDRAAKPGWTVDWRAVDRNHYVADGTEIHLHYTDLTTDAQASTCEGWICPSHFNSTEQDWLPRIMVRRRGEGTVDGPGGSLFMSTFVSVIEPHGPKRQAKAVRRLPLTTSAGKAWGDPHVAVEVALVDGRSDLIVAGDAENATEAEPALAKGEALCVKEWSVSLTGELATVRCDAAGKVVGLALGRGKKLVAGDLEMTIAGDAEFVELAVAGETFKVLAGDPTKASLSRGGNALRRA
ncbi:MAG: hypothetical protein NTW19_22565 [Planctomycetota bacterium]|nr:hypothetical protein [Planctomycetota bacterium]